jgi:hypothetical protein
MGNSAAGGRTTRALRRLGPVVAAAAGAAVVAATVMGRRRRPPEQPGLASPASAADPVLAPVTDLSAARATRATVIASAAAADAEPARSVRPLSGPGHDLRPAAAAAGASGSGEQPAAPGTAVGTQAAVGPADEPWPVEPAATTSTGASAPAGSLPPNEPTGRAAAAAAAATPDAHAGGPPRRPPAAAAATPDTHAAGPPGRPAGLAPRRIRDRAGLGPSRRSRAVLGGVVALGLVAGVGAVVASSGGGDRPDTAAIESGTAGQAGSEGDAIGEGGTATEAGGDAASTTEVDVTMTTPVAVTAATAFPAAADRLTAAGTFSYTGTVSATDVSHVRPMLWLSVESTLEGQVSLAAGRLHETATTSDGRVAETVTSGPQVWGRRAGSREGLAAVPYESVPALSDAEPATKGAVLLPAWLASVVNPADAGPDESGRRRFSATVPATVLGAIERERPPVDATVVLTLDAAGAPVRVEITSAPGGPPLHLVYDLAGLGAPVDIQPPA